VGISAGNDDVEKRKFLTLPGLQLLPLYRPARSQSLYRLSYRGSLRKIILKKKTILKIGHSHKYSADVFNRNSIIRATASVV
jgi:hypothetical protein